MSPPWTYADATINRTLSPEQKIELYRQMVRARWFEKRGIAYYGAGKMGGWLNLQIGQEAIAVAFRSLMTADDHSLTGFRGIGHALAAGMSMKVCMAELYGKASGSSKGKGGMMGMFAPDRNYWGGHSVAAAQTPLAAGLAFGLKYREVAGVVCCFLGDGAVNQGCFHESLNLAGLFDLPVIYVIENNGYAMGMSVKRSSAFKSCLAQRAETYDIEWDILNGDDLYEIRAKAEPAFERARRESRPTVLEISTYRFFGHTIADANQKLYRAPADIEERKLNHDPILRWHEQLVREGVLDDATAKAIGESAKSEAEAAGVFADESRSPEAAEITQDVYWESDHQTSASKVGWHQFDD